MTDRILSLSTTIAMTAALFLSALAGCRPAQKEAAKPEVPTHLPRTARPIHYSISVVPDAPNLRFSASTVIEIEILQSTDSVTLNAADLDFQSVALTDDANKTIEGAPQSMRLTRPPPSSSLRIWRPENIGSRLITPARSTGTRPVFSPSTTTAGRAQARALHPVRSGRCAPLFSLLGRAEFPRPI